MPKSKDTPTADDFEGEIRRRLGGFRSSAFLDVRAGDVHTSVGGYPSTNHRMPACCGVMRRLMGPRDEVLSTPPKGNGASLTIRHQLPRD